MATPPKKNKLNYSKPVRTRGGSAVRIYEIFYNDYLNGAYYDESSDVWFPAQWSFDGGYAQKPSSLDLVNINE